MLLPELREQVLEANLELVKRGLVLYTFGNASGVDRDGGLVVIKPSGVDYDDLRPEHMVVTDLHGRIVEGDLRPSSDLDTHTLLYREFPTIGAVVHTHSEYATSFAQAGLPIPPLGTTHADYFYGPIPCTDPLSDNAIGGRYVHETGLAIVRRFRGHLAHPTPAEPAHPNSGSGRRQRLHPRPRRQFRPHPHPSRRPTPPHRPPRRPRLPRRWPRPLRLGPHPPRSRPQRRRPRGRRPHGLSHPHPQIRSRPGLPGPARPPLFPQARRKRHLRPDRDHPKLKVAVAVVVVAVARFTVVILSESKDPAVAVAVAVAAAVALHCYCNCSCCCPFLVVILSEAKDPRISKLQLLLPAAIARSPTATSTSRYSAAPTPSAANTAPASRTARCHAKPPSTPHSPAPASSAPS